MSLADSIVAEALAAEGLSASVDPVAFGSFMGGPGESPQVCLSMATARMQNGQQVSTCGLVLRAIWRRAGVDDPRVRAPYQNGTAISALLAIATERGASIASPTLDGYFPKPGDSVGVNLDQPNGHVYAVIASDPASRQLVSIDGGVVDGGGGQCAQRRHRTWSDGGGVIIDAPQESISRRVTHIFRADALEANGPTVVTRSASASSRASPLVLGIVLGIGYLVYRHLSRSA